MSHRSRSSSGCGKVGSAFLSTFPQPGLGYEDLLKIEDRLTDFSEKILPIEEIFMSDRTDWIIQYFGFLVNDYGFRVEEKEFTPQMMENAYVLFTSLKTGIEVVIDRNQVLISMGDKSEAKEFWFEFSDVLRYFAPSEVPYIFYERTDDMTWDEAVKAQLSRTSILLRCFCEPMLKGELRM